MTSDTAEQFGNELSAFEITAEQRRLAANNEAGYPKLDAGRGNPNWINTKVRSAFSRLMDFANEECRLVFENGDMSGHGNKDGISERFDKFMNKEDETDRFLLDAVNHCETELGMDRDDLLFEFSNGIIGDYYPDPSRCLENTEKILNEYITSTLFNGKSIEGGTDIFPTEGGSAAMCYVFHSLNHNYILKPGDKIAIGTPIFTPYLEIPDVNNYGLVSVDVASDKDHNWDIDTKELDKLRDKDIKAFFLVNPSNPASHALSSKTIEYLRDVVEDNPDLIILTDDVYGTFVTGFESVYSAIPYNTILVYSFSKLYGVTGWRTGLIAMNSDNVVDRLISELPEEDKKSLEKEYSIAASEPDKLKFIDRLTADSRSIGLYHTSGLSTPSQIFMDLMALSHTTYEEDEYIKAANALVNERYCALMNALGLEADTGRENAMYYALVDINALITDKYGEEFAKWKADNISDLDFLNDLAKKKGVVLMYGPGFDAPEGSVRISLANLNTEDYEQIALRIMELLDEYYEEFADEQGQKAA
ncbi:MAG: bifunctional aspartate transaminase/aspartate 4-decarboxylase [Lachnospiraceae bacterium]|nr:bifunctional aspartate transaminase/aspartate 4-decarboxylase [Lachnospiraceae bacterium]